MGESFLEFMKGIGIFIVCAQSFLYFSAGKSYEKYVKLLIGVMILAQFVVPVRNLFLGSEGGELHEEVERFQAELEYAMQTASQTVQESGLEIEERDSMEPLEAEMEQRLAQTAKNYGYRIAEVRMMEEPPKAVIVVEAMGEAVPIQIDKIDRIQIGQNGTSETETETEHAQTGDSVPELREVFADLLGTEEDYVEVVTE